LTLVDCSTGVRATADSPIVSKCFIVDSSWSAYYRGSVCRWPNPLQGVANMWIIDPIHAALTAK
jgi:hypothetical protein